MMPNNRTQRRTLKGATAAAVVVALLTTLLQAGQGDALGIPKFLEFGACSPVTPQPNLNFEKYSGIWFPVEMVPNEYVDIASCAMTNYTWEEDLMLVEDRGLSEGGVKIRQRSVMFPTEEVPGLLTVDAEGVPSAPYVVVDTDYERYSCVHSCLSWMGFRAAFSWVMSRRPTLDPALIQHCHARFREWNIDPSSMLPVTQGKECPYLNKLDAVLDYNASVQKKATAREMSMHKGRTSTKAGATKAMMSHRAKEEEEAMEDEREETYEEFPLQDERQPGREAHQVLQHGRTDIQHAAEGAALSGSEASHRGTDHLLPLLLTPLLLLVTSPSTLNW